MPITHLSQQQREYMMVDDGRDVQIMRVIMADLPPALTLDMIKQAVTGDKTYQDLMEAVRSGVKSTDQHLSKYMSVWPELTVTKILPRKHLKTRLKKGKSLPKKMETLLK